MLIFTMHESADLAAQTLRIGAAGYITKSSPPDSLGRAVHDIVAGGRPVSPDVARALRGSAEPHRVRRTRRSRRASSRSSCCWPEAMASKQIAAARSLSTKTIANYQTSIRQKTGLGSSLEMYRYAEAHGLLPTSAASLRARSTARCASAEVRAQYAGRRACAVIARDGPISISPPCAHTRSRMPARPLPRCGALSAESSPMPSSSTHHSISAVSRARRRARSTRVASACRAALVSASCVSRYSTSARSSGTHAIVEIVDSANIRRVDPGRSRQLCTRSSSRRRNGTPVVPASLAAGAGDAGDRAPARGTARSAARVRR